MGQGVLKGWSSPLRNKLAAPNPYLFTAPMGEIKLQQHWCAQEQGQLVSIPAGWDSPSLGWTSLRAGWAIRGRTTLKFEPNKITGLILLSVGFWIPKSPLWEKPRPRSEWCKMRQYLAQNYCGLFFLIFNIRCNNCKDQKLWVLSAVPWDPLFQRMV